MSTKKKCNFLHQHCSSMIPIKYHQIINNDNRNFLDPFTNRNVIPYYHKFFMLLLLLFQILLINCMFFF